MLNKIRENSSLDNENEINIPKINKKISRTSERIVRLEIS